MSEYASKRFDDYRALVDFLNEKEIQTVDIIQITHAIEKAGYEEYHYYTLFYIDRQEVDKCV